MSFGERLTSAGGLVQACLVDAMVEYAPSVIADAMLYATQGGKGLRGFLVVEGAALYGIAPDQARWAGAAVEAIHAYSLVHDDLPAMDNDDLRRGQPTVHRKWDDATAVLAGDALQTLAFDLLSRDACASDAQVRLNLIATMAQAAGANGMVLGQALDIAAETAEMPLTLEEINRLQAGKTGALIEWSGVAGAILAKADPSPLRQYARALGLAFQIADDILDIEGDAETAGKRLQKDADAGKATFVSLMGLEPARVKACDLIETACAALEPYGPAADTLKDAARFVIARDK